MKKSLFFAILFLLVSIQANAQEVTFRGFTLRYNEAAANDICFSVDVLDDKGNDLALCKDARATIVYLTTQCQCKLTPKEKKLIYYVSHQEVPQLFNVLQYKTNNPNSK